MLPGLLIQQQVLSKHGDFGPKTLPLTGMGSFGWQAQPSTSNWHKRGRHRNPTNTNYWNPHKWKKSKLLWGQAPSGAIEMKEWPWMSSQCTGSPEAGGLSGAEPCPRLAGHGTTRDGRAKATDQALSTENKLLFFLHCSWISENSWEQTKKSWGAKAGCWN